MRRTDALMLLGLLVLPVGLQWGVGDAVIGLESDDLSGHLWTLWNATRGPMTSTELVNAPSGVDLMPIVGGWLDIRLGSWLAPWLGVAGAYNAVLSLYLLLAGVGGFLLARALGARTGGGVLAGVLLQLDPFILLHLGAGRPEQASLGLVAMALAGALGAWYPRPSVGAPRRPQRGRSDLPEVGRPPGRGDGLLAGPCAPPAATAAPWLLAAGITAMTAGPGRLVPATHRRDSRDRRRLAWPRYRRPREHRLAAVLDGQRRNPGLVPTLTCSPFRYSTGPAPVLLGLWGILALAFVFA